MVLHMDATTCKVETCDKPAQRKGYCGAHYMQQHRYGTTQPVKPQRKICPTCSTLFQPTANRQTYCTVQCRNGGKGVCVGCGAAFDRSDATRTETARIIGPRILSCGRSRAAARKTQRVSAPPTTTAPVAVAGR
jgi:hypothetical protein